MTKKSILIMAAVSLMICCGENRKSFVNKDAERSIPPAQAVISSETATLIARGFLCFEHNDLRDRKVLVNETDEGWQILFVRTKNLEAEGGDPVVTVSKKNGEILSALLGK